MIRFELSEDDAQFLIDMVDFRIIRAGEEAWALGKQALHAEQQQALKIEQRAKNILAQIVMQTGLNPSPFA